MKFRTSRQFLSRLASRRAARVFHAALLLTFSSLPVARAVNYYWDPTQTASTNGSGSGTWDKTALDFYNGTSDVAWADGNTAVFGGPTGIYAVSLGVPISALGLMFNTSGYTITASATNKLTLTGTAGVTTATSAGTTTLAGAIVVDNGNTSQTWAVGTGDTLNITGSVAQGATTTGTSTNLVFSGAGTFNYSGSAFTPFKFTINGGATTNSTGIANIPAGGTYTGIGDGSSGTLNVTAGTFATAATVFLGNTTTANATDTGTLTVSGTGAVTTTANINVGDGYNNNANGVGVITISAGTFSTGTSTGTIRLGNAGSGSGTLNLNGGTFSTNSSITQGSFATTTTGFTKATVLNFNGGTLQATGTGLGITGSVTANVRNSGAIIDTNGNAVSITAALVHSTVSGDNATDGGLTKNGSGALTLNGTDTFNGTTVINAGSIVTGAAGSLGSSTLNYNSQGGTLSFGTLTAATLGGLSGSQALALTNTTPAAVALTVGANNSSNTYTGALTGAGSLTKNGTGTFILSGTGNTYSGTTTASGGTLAGVGANAFGNTSSIIVTGGTLSLRGDSSTSFVQSTGGANYSVLASSGSTYNVDDATAAGAGVAKTMTIGAFTTASTSTAYALNFTGANNTSLSTGSITGGASGSAGVDTIQNTISGGGSLTIASYTSGNTTGGDTLTFIGTGNTIVTGAITPSTTTLAVSKGGTGTLTLNGTSTYTGATTVTSGTLNLNGSTSGSNIVVNGASARFIESSTGVIAGSANTFTLTTGAATLAGANTYTGGTTVAAGTLTLANNTAAGSGTISVGTAGNVATGTLALTGGITVANAFTLTGSRSDPTLGGTAHIDNVSGNNTITASGFAIAGGGLGNIFQSDAGTLTFSGNLVGNNSATYTRPYFLTGAGNGVVSGNIANGTAAGGTSIVKSGTGIWTLTGTNAYVGPTTINAGTIDLGGSTANGSINAGSALILGGGTLNYTRTGTNTQTFNGTTFNSGGSTINVSQGNTLALGAITRNAGATVFMNTTGAITTTTANRDGNTSNTNTNGFLGAYAVYGSYDWASNNGGTVTYFSGYTTYDNVASVPANVDLTDNGNGYDGSSTGGATTVNSVRFNEGSSDSTINLGGNLTVNSGGILVTPNLGAKYARINGTGLTTTTTDLVVQQQNTGTGHLQIGSSIYGAIGLTKAGPGQLDINGTSASYTGATTVNGGTLFIQATTAVNGNFGLTGTSSVIVNNTGTVLLGGSNQINNAATLTLNGGTFNTGGYSQGAATGSATATQGLGALTLSSSSTLDFGVGHAGSSVLAFAASNGQTWNGTLTLTDFTPGTDYLNFASSTGLTTTQLGEISLTGFSATGLDSFGDVVFTSVPEPATWAVGILLLGATGWTIRRRAACRAA